MDKLYCTERVLSLRTAQHAQYSRLHSTLHLCSTLLSYMRRCDPAFVLQHHKVQVNAHTTWYAASQRTVPCSAVPRYYTTVDRNIGGRHGWPRTISRFHRKTRDTEYTLLKEKNIKHGRCEGWKKWRKWTGAPPVESCGAPPSPPPPPPEEGSQGYSMVRQFDYEAIFPPPPWVHT